MSESHRLADHFFRREYGRLVASLSRRVGVQNLELVEDAAQSALLRALDHWPRAGLPESPAGWLFRVAHHEIIEELRSGTRRRRILESASHGEVNSTDEEEPFLASEVADDLLPMLFACCDEQLPRESQLVLALKVLCGFDIREIAARLFVSEESAYKRLGRARKRLVNSDWELRPSNEKLRPRLGAVHQVIYLMFTEGYFSLRADETIRRELCEEALRLGVLLAEHPIGDAPASDALVALMKFHLARMNSRLDAHGEMLLLGEQDRRTWDQGTVAQGLRWLERSARGDVLSRYHAEAAIAAEHCLAPSVRMTNWAKIVGLYEQLESQSPSPLHRLNRALAVAEWKDAEAGLAVLSEFVPPTWLEGSYLWSAALADLNRRAGHEDAAEEHRGRTLRLAPNDAVRTLLVRRWTKH